MLRVLVPALLLLVASEARAQPRAQPGEPLGPLFVEGGSGLGSPVGLLGVSAGLLPSEWFGIRVGGGVGLDGPQAAWSLDAYLPMGRQTLGLEVGTALGPYSYGANGPFSGYANRFEWSVAHRAHVALSLRFRSGRAWWVRFVAGGRRVLNVGDARCVGPDGERCDVRPSTGDSCLLFRDLASAYTGVAVAYTFGS